MFIFHFTAIHCISSCGKYMQPDNIKTTRISEIKCYIFYISQKINVLQLDQLHCYVYPDCLQCWFNRFSKVCRFFCYAQGNDVLFSHQTFCRWLVSILTFFFLKLIIFFQRKVLTGFCPFLLFFWYRLILVSDLITSQYSIAVILVLSDLIIIMLNIEKLQDTTG